MICPNCNIAQLEIKNNNYYCPGCRIYIGPVKKDVSGFSAQAATSKWQIQTPPKNPDQSDEWITGVSKIEDIKLFIRRYLLPVFAMVSILTLVVLSSHIINNFSNYISLVPFCSIKIEEKTKDFKVNISNILSDINRRNQPEYKNICKYITNIVEGSCPVSDEGESGVTNVQFEDHCYIKGTKIIYLNNLGYLEQSADFSKNYWEKNN